MQKKKCTKCKKDKLLNEFVKNKRQKDGLFSWCKICHKENQKKVRQKNKDKNKNQNEIYESNNKRCSDCKIEKQIIYFDKNIQTTDGLRSICKSCDYNRKKQLRSKYFENNSEKLSKEIYNKIIEKKCNLCKEKKKSIYFSINRRAFDGLNNVCKNCQKLYRETVKGKFKAIKGSAKKRGLAFEINFKDFEEKFWQKNCFYCNTKNTIGIDRLNSDMGYMDGNIVPCCYNCNIAKAELTELEFYKHIFKIVLHLKNNDQEKYKIVENFYKNAH